MDLLGVCPDVNGSFDEVCRTHAGVTSSKVAPTITGRYWCCKCLMSPRFLFSN